MLGSNHVKDASPKKGIIMKYIIDRFEGDFAICEDENGNIVDIKKDKIPREAAEGDVLIIEDENIMIALLETEERKKQIKTLADELFL